MRLPLSFASLFVLIAFAACAGGSGGGPGGTVPSAPKPPGDVTASVALSAGGNYRTRVERIPVHQSGLLTYDESSGHELTSLPLNYPQGAYPSTMSLSAGFDKLYIGAYGPIVNDAPSTFPLPGLTIVDTQTNAILHQTTINGGVFAGMLSADGTRYYGAGENEGNNALFVFDAATGALLNTITLPPRNPAGLAVPDAVAVSGTTAYVDSGDGVYIYKVDLSTNAVTTFVSSCGCSVIGLNQTATKLFVNQTGQGIRVLNPATAATIGLIAPPSGIASFLGDASLSADASTILVGDQYKAVGPTGPAQYGAAVISTSTGAVTGTFSVPMIGKTTVNTNGRSGLFWTGEIYYPGVDARALPIGQLYYSLTTPSGSFAVSAAAQ